MAAVTIHSDFGAQEKKICYCFHFPSSIYHKEGWAPQNWCFWTVMLEKTFESPLDSMKIEPVNPKGNQSWMLIGNIDAKAPILWHLMGRADSLENTLMLGKIEDRSKRGWQRRRWLDDIIDSMDMSLSKFWEIVKYRGAWRATVHGVTKSRTWLRDWTTLWYICVYIICLNLSLKIWSLKKKN